MWDQTVRLFGVFGMVAISCHFPKEPDITRRKTLKGEPRMKDKLLKLAIKMQVLLNEEGQDLIEYALVVALIAFAATAGMNTLATALNAAFAQVATTLSTSIT
jgi:pilus assembly protein Flp/PilA